MGFVFIAHFPTSAWQSNCYLIATKEAAECVIVDPGPQSFARVKQLVRDHQLAPQGVLLTHGHVDHVADAAAVAAEYGIPVWIHPHDQELLSNPLAGLGQSFSHFLQQTLGTTTLTPPKDVRDLVGQESLKIAGISFDITHLVFFWF